MKKFFTDPTYRVEAVIFALSIVIAAPLLVYTWMQPWAYRHTSDGLGIAAFPTVFLVGMILFGAICFFGDYMDCKRGVIPPASDVVGMDWKSTVLVGVISLLSPVTIFLIDPLLYVAVLCLVILLLGRVRKWSLLVIPAICLVVFIYVFMIKIADVFFPTTWFF